MMLLTTHELESGQSAIQGCPTLIGHSGSVERNSLEERVQKRCLGGSRFVIAAREDEV